MVIWGRSRYDAVAICQLVRFKTPETYRLATISSGLLLFLFVRSNAYPPSRYQLLFQLNGVWTYLTRPQFRQQNIIHDWPRLFPSERLFLLIYRTPFQHSRVNIRVVVQFPRIRLSLLGIWASITSDPEIHDDCIVIEMFVGSWCYFISSPLPKFGMTYGERRVYEDPPLGELSPDDVIGLHLA